MSIKIENTQVFGWEGAIRGCRNPMNSWEKSDSLWFDGEEYHDICGNSGPAPKESNGTGFDIGYSDHKLLMNLCKGGTEEAKWRRMIHVQMDVTAPLYWWKEFTLDDFSCDHLKYSMLSYLKEYIGILNLYRWIYNVFDEKSSDPNWFKSYVEDYGMQTKKDIWWQMIQLLPTSYNQKRTIDLNYEVLASQYRQRKAHRLDEWHQYCDWIKTLPYSEFITMEEN